VGVQLGLDQATTFIVLFLENAQLQTTAMEQPAFTLQRAERVPPDAKAFAADSATETSAQSPNATANSANAASAKSRADQFC
jgi:hypothetical protein